MIKKSNEKLIALQLVTEQIEKQGIDVAPQYADYMRIAFGIANDCGEDGREYFHRICKLYKNYNESDVDKLFTGAVKKGHKGNGLGSLFEIAERAGVDVGAVKFRAKEMAAECVSDASVAIGTGASGAGAVGAPPFFEKDGMVTGDAPMSPLPTFARYDWPSPLNKVGIVAENDAQRDAMLLSAVVVLGSMLGPSVKFLYDKKYWSPNLYSFLVAPPSAGKSVVNFNKQLAMPLHKERRDKYEMEMNEYRLKLESQRFKKGDDTKEFLVPPANRMFLIAGDNTGAGITLNIIESGGHALLFETEAETLSKSIDSDQGHFSDLLRKCHDHEAIAYNRKTNNEYREVGSSYFSMMLCGTPDQVRKLVPSVENGLFSRILFYFFTADPEWKSQFGEDSFDGKLYFEQLSLEWKKELDKIQSEGTFVMFLSKEQQDLFNDEFARLLKLSQALSDNEVNSFVRRLGLNLLRLMSVVALLRSREEGYRDMVKASGRTDEGSTGGCQLWNLSVTDSDFLAVLSMADVFFSHALHVVSFLQSSSNNVRKMNSEQQAFYNRLSDEFSAGDVKDLSQEMGINYNTAKSWLNRWKKKKDFIVEDTGRGCYIKVQQKKGGAPSAPAPDAPEVLKSA